MKRCLLFAGVLALFVSCHNSGYNNVSPRYDTFSYPSYNYSPGNGTDNNSGAMALNITPYGYNASNQVYQVSINGVGNYYVPTGGGQVYIPYLWPGTYYFTIHIGCVNYYAPNCFDRYVNGSISIQPLYTTQVQFQPS